MMEKMMFLSLFIGLPIACGEWDGPFWVQAVLALLMFVPFITVLHREMKNQ